MCAVQVALDLYVTYALVPPCSDWEEKELIWEIRPKHYPKIFPISLCSICHKAISRVEGNQLHQCWRIIVNFHEDFLWKTATEVFLKLTLVGYQIIECGFGTSVTV